MHTLYKKKHRLEKYAFLYTVKVMIMSRYRYRPVTVLGPTLPTVTVFGPTLPNVTQHDINVTDRYCPLPIVIKFYRYLRYKRYRS